ncbi:MAG: DegQ family serine endoprotease [Rhodospirillaceae bacterium]|nr:DegQ family serine endoprotease [Rhodospirillaceae bacterium]
MSVRFHRFVLATAAAAALFATPAVNAAAQSAIPTRDGMPTLAPLVEKVVPGVVNIAVKAKVEVSADNPLFNDPMFRRFFGDKNAPKMPERSAVGSGIIIDAKQGYILTNHHVIEDASDIAVTLSDRRVFTAKVVGSDDQTDIAVLKVDAKNLTAIPMGDSEDVKVGDYVIAVGNPFALGQTVTAGIVSAKGRGSMGGTMGIEGYEDFIQTDASINPGNSGGALVNLKGELVGMNTAIVGPSGGNVGIGFAVPTSMIKGVMAQLTQYGEVKRGIIGVGIQDLNPELAKNLGMEQTEGALVGSIAKGSPAEAAGVKAGDVVVAMDGRPVRSSGELRNRIGLLTVGTSINLTIVRDKVKKDFKVTIGKAPAEQEVAKVNDRPELEGATFSSAASDDKVKGVVVTQIERNSPAAQRFRQGDHILSVNRKPVNTVEEFKTALKDSGRSSALFVKRGEEDVLIVLQ